MLRLATLYAGNQQSLILHSAASCGLFFALSIGGFAFGITISCLMLALFVAQSETSILRDGPQLTLFLVFGFSGLFNDLQLSLMVGIVAFVSTPAIVAIGNKGIASIGTQTKRHLSAWLPAGLLTVALTVLAHRDRSLVALLLVLIYFHDLGVYLFVRARLRKHFALILACAGTIALLWTAIQVSVSPIPSEWFWAFAALVGFGIPASRIFTELMVAKTWEAARSISSYVLTGPIWTAAALGLGL